MADSIKIDVKELFTRIKEIYDDGMDIVDLTILEADEFDGEELPVCIALTACKRDNTSIWADYEEIDEVSDL